jgi:hypothetical protein
MMADDPTAAEHDPVAAAWAIVDANLYMVLGTADPEGRPTSLRRGDRRVPVSL